MPGPLFEVVDGGLLTTIQDAGRPGWAAMGVPRGGACDPTSLAIANLLVGNPADTAALEATVVGPELLVLRDVVFGLAGADLGAVAMPSGRRLPGGAAHALRSGERLAIAGSETTSSQGCRAYLAVPGGFAADVVLGSAATSLVGAFGGLGGRAIRAGDQLAAGEDRAEVVAQNGERRWPSDLRLPVSGDEVAILAGPGATSPAGRAALETLTGATWAVASASDRRGLRLEGPALDLALAADGPSHGVPTGTIQVTPSGLPIVLLPDAGPTGGYPILAVVASAALPLVGQARPGTSIRFRLVCPDEARALERERRDILAAGAARLGRSDPWDDLAGLAGA